MTFLSRYDGLHDRYHALLSTCTGYMRDARKYAQGEGYQACRAARNPRGGFGGGVGNSELVVEFMASMLFSFCGDLTEEIHRLPFQMK
jgi:hypothetical protein